MNNNKNNFIEELLECDGDEGKIVGFFNAHPEYKKRKYKKQLQQELKEREKAIHEHYQKKVKALEIEHSIAQAQINGLSFPKNRPIKERMDWLKNTHPDIFSDVFSKQYDDVSNYEDYRENLCLAALMFVFEKMQIETESLTGLDRVKTWKKHGYPNFFASLGITEAIENTDLSDNQMIDPLKIALPYEAFTIVFPRNKSPFRLIHVERDTDTLYLHGTFREESNAEGFWESEPFKIKDVAYPHNLLADWFFKILYVMHSKPEILQVSQHLGTNKKNNIKWYSPVIIGKKYTYKSSDDRDNSGYLTSRKTHWRRGHFRHQQFGSRESPQIKVIWIEPMIINAE